MSILSLLRLLLLASLASSASAASPGAVTAALEPHLGQLTYVDFWASWCTPCAQSFPWLNELQARYAAQGLRVVGVGLDTEPAKGDRFLLRHPARFAIVRDPAGRLAEHFGVAGMPYSVLLDADGRVIHRHVGFKSAQISEYERAIQAALATPLPHP